MIVLGVIGWPLGHSLSPHIHARALEAVGREGWYVPFPVPPEELSAAVRGLWSLGVQGFNVTIPHKEAVRVHLVALDEVARAVGAVNTVWRTPEGWAGGNTDVEGFLRATGEAVPRGGTALVLGAGGAARAVAYALATAGVGTVLVSARSAARAQGVAELAAGAGARSRVVPWAERERPGQVVDLLVQATPVGMWPHVGEAPVSDLGFLSPGAAVVDLVYRPLETTLLALARQTGFRAVDGLGMLCHQASLSWRHWFGEEGPVAVMREAAEEVLRRSHEHP